MRIKRLTKEQIEEAKYLRSMGYTKNGLAKLYGIGQTTVWENIFSKTKRAKRKQPPPRIENRIPCEICERLMEEYNDTTNPPANLRMSYKCLACYLEENGLQYRNIFNYDGTR